MHGRLVANTVVAHYLLKLSQREFYGPNVSPCICCGMALLTLVGVVLPLCWTPSLFLRVAEEVPNRLAPLPSDRNRLVGVEGVLGWPLCPLPIPPPDQLSVETFLPSVAAYLQG